MATPTTIHKCNDTNCAPCLRRELTRVQEILNRVYAERDNATDELELANKECGKLRALLTQAIDMQATIAAQRWAAKKVTPSRNTMDWVERARLALAS